MTDQERIEAKLRIEAQYSNGASWFYWIAALSLINTIISLFNGSVGFISGLGITQIIDVAAYIFSDYFGKGIIYAGMFINIIIIAVFFVIGILSYKKKIWAMILGCVFYSLDLLSFIFITDYLSIAFHALAIYSIIKGIKAAKKLKDIEQFDLMAAAENEELTV